MRSRFFFSKRTVVAIVGFFCAALGHVEGHSDPAHVFEVTPFFGYADGGAFEDPVDGSKREFEGHTHWGLMLSLPADYSSHYELLFSNQNTEVEGATPLDMRVQYLQIGGTLSYPDATRVIPYFGLTAGATRFSPSANGLDDETKFSFSIGAGLRVPIAKHVGVRFDARAFVTSLNIDSNIFCVTPSTDGLVCRIRARSDTLVQYAASLGVSYGF